MTQKKTLFAGMYGAVLGLLLPLTAPAVTTESAIPVTTVEQATSTYDAGSVRMGADNVLTDSEALGHPVSSLGQAAGLVAAESATAIADDVSAGATVFRRGIFPKPEANWPGNSSKGLDWAPENPLTTPNFVKDYGLPSGNSAPVPDWVVGGRVRPGGIFRIEPAPGIGPNTGGKLQVTIPNSEDVVLDFFHMP